MLRLTDLALLRCALVVAHPGHELRVHGWLEQARPTVHVLTDGSGRVGPSRLDATSRLLERCGCHPGAVYGVCSDRALYQALLAHDSDRILELVEQLSEALIEQRIQAVVGDAAEGTIMAHDLWRGVIDAAIERAAQVLGRPIASYDFPIDRPPDTCPAALRQRAIWLRLDDEALQRKIQAALENHQLAGEVRAAIQTLGVARFQVECLRPVSEPVWLQYPQLYPQPAYEQHGEQLVASGQYPVVVRYQEHIAPLFAQLRNFCQVKHVWRCAS